MFAYQPPAVQPPVLLYEDDDLLAVDKPAGLLSVPGRGETKQDCLSRRVQDTRPSALVVHRLDMATSGVLLMAKHPGMQHQLGALFEKRQIEKRYIAVVDGLLAQDTGQVSAPLCCDWPNRPRQHVDPLHGRPALTRYTLLERRVDNRGNSGTSRVLLMPETGRSHQLRVHMQVLGHPILGDELYAPASVAQASDRLLLHAVSLSFIHPASGEALAIHSDVPF